MEFGYGVNYVHALVATIATFFIGGLWHGPVFGKTWMKLMNFTPKSVKEMKLTPMQAMVTGFFSMAVLAIVIAHLVAWLGLSGLADGLVLAFVLWLGLELPIVLGGYIWEGKSFELFLFNAVYRLVELSILTCIIAAWA